MTAPPPSPSGPGSRTLIVTLLVAAALAALLPMVVARTRGVRIMSAGLAEVLTECRARYTAAATAADTAAVDAWQPSLHGERRTGDPVCGSYRRRNMIQSVP